jgi:hypothetical protein
VLLITFLIVRGQLALNTYWTGLKDSGRIIPVRTHWLEWVALAAGVILVLLYVLGQYLP